jgi:hypothetical protein
MRRNLIAALLFLGMTTLTLAVWAQDGEPPEPDDAPPLAVTAPPEQIIRGEWQPIELIPADPPQFSSNQRIFSTSGGADSCLSATELLSIPGGDGGAVIAANIDNSDPDLSCMWGTPKRVKGYRTVWYKFTAPTYGFVTIDTIGSNYDTVLAIHTGGCASPVEVACNDDQEGFSSRTTFPVVQNEEYYVEVADWQESVPPAGPQLSIFISMELFNSKWDQVGVMSSARSRHASVVVGDDIYVVGGQSGSSVLKHFDRYETDTGNWVTLPDMLGTSGYSNTTAAFVDGPGDSGRIYLPSGVSDPATFLGDHLVYDLSFGWDFAPTAPWPGGNPIAWSEAIETADGYYLTGGLSVSDPISPG